MHFSLDEYQDRLARVRESMAERDIDLLLLFGQEAIDWVSGFYTPAHFAYACFGVPLEGEPFLIVRYLEEKAVHANSWVQNYQIYWDHEDYIEKTRDMVCKAGFGKARIGLEKHSWFLTADRCDRLRDALPDATFVSDDRLVDRLRFIKSAAELDYLRQAAKIVGAGMRGAVNATKVGATEREIAAEMAYERLRAGSDLPVDGVLTTGERILEGHGPWTDRVLREGDGLHYEFHGIKANYWARLERSGVLGEPTQRQRFVADTVLFAQNQGLAKMKAGVHCSVIDQACREPMLEAGLKVKETYTNRMGYGIGLNMRPSPGEFLCEFTPTADFVLAPGMVFHMVMAAEGLGYSDTVVVTDDGIEYLTDYPREMLIVPVR